MSYPGTALHPGRPEHDALEQRVRALEERVAGLERQMRDVLAAGPGPAPRPLTA